MGQASGFGERFCKNKFFCHFDCEVGSLTMLYVQDEAIQKRNMVPLEIYKSNNFSLSTSRWRVLDPGVLSPWNVMNWSLRQLKGLVVGTDNGSAKLRTQTLVLVDNLKVCGTLLQLGFRQIMEADMHGA